MKININQTCRVVLTPYGENIMRDRGMGWMFTHESIWNPVSKVLKTQLWDLMQIFGNCLYMGNPKIPFEHNEIEIENY